MPLSPTEVIQSFRLRFWRESHQGKAGEWRGDVWHEQQKPDEQTVPIANPEEAFEVVRHTLQLSLETRPAPISSAETVGMEGSSRTSTGEGQVQTLTKKPLLHSICRIFRGQQS